MLHYYIGYIDTLIYCCWLINTTPFGNHMLHFSSLKSLLYLDVKLDETLSCANHMVFLSHPI